MTGIIIVLQDKSILQSHITNLNKKKAYCIRWHSKEILFKNTSIRNKYFDTKLHVKSCQKVYFQSASETEQTAVILMQYLLFKSLRVLFNL